MALSCDLTNRRKGVGNKVSHSNRKSKRKFKLNVHEMSLYSQVLQQSFGMKISTKTLRTIDLKGGLDEYLLSSASRKLSNLGRKFKRDIINKTTKVQ